MAACRYSPPPWRRGSQAKTPLRCRWKNSSYLSFVFLAPRTSAARAQLYRADSRAGTGIENDDLLTAVRQHEVDGESAAGLLHRLDDGPRRQIEDRVERR